MTLPGTTLSIVRVGLSLAGFAVALLAVALENRQLGWAAIALLIGSLIVRLLQRGRDHSV